MPKLSRVVPDRLKGTRLDRVATELFDVNRSQIQRAIAEERLLLNGKACKANLSLKGGETLTLAPDELKALVDAPPLKIIREEKNFVVINKPAGVLVHEARGSRAPVLTVALVKKYPEIKKVGDPARPGIVHRLDRDVSGVMVVARTKPMFEHLKKEFAARRVEKAYTALVNGVIEKPEGEIDFSLGRSKRTGLMAARPKSDTRGREALTQFVVKKTYPHLTLLEVKIVTGRTHQIRAHLKAIDHPIVGDTLYGGKNPKASTLARPFLEATQLAFLDLEGERQAFSVPLDKDLLDYLNNLEVKKEKKP